MKTFEIRKIKKDSSAKITYWGHKKWYQSMYDFIEYHIDECEDGWAIDYIKRIN